MVPQLSSVVREITPVPAGMVGMGVELRAAPWLPDDAASGAPAQPARPAVASAGAAIVRRSFLRLVMGLLVPVPRSASDRGKDRAAASSADELEGDHSEHQGQE